MGCRFLGGNAFFDFPAGRSNILIPSINTPSLRIHFISLFFSKMSSRDQLEDAGRLRRAIPPPPPANTLEELLAMARAVFGDDAPDSPPDFPHHSLPIPLRSGFSDANVDASRIRIQKLSVLFEHLQVWQEDLETAESELTLAKKEMNEAAAAVGAAMKKLRKRKRLEIGTVHAARAFIQLRERGCRANYIITAKRTKSIKKITDILESSGVGGK